MNLDEFENRALYMQELEKMESRPAAYDPSEGMSEGQLHSFVRFLMEQIKIKEKDYALLLQRIAQLCNQIEEQNQTIQEMSQTLNKLQEQNTILKAERFGSSKSRKGLGKQCKVRGKNDGRDDFDGTNSSLSSEETKDDDDNLTPQGGVCSSESGESPQKVYHGPSRKGYKYNKQVVGEPIYHAFDKTSLPEGCKILKVLSPKVVRNLVSYVEEHHFERLKVLFPDGETRTVVCPEDIDGKNILEETVPGTHISATILSNLAFNHYQMSCPNYRESKNRWSDMSWNTCRQNLANWLDKGAVFLNKLLPALKTKILAPGSNVNVDETWCRYQTHYGHKKTYMWCMVNRKARIVMFFYEDCVDANGKKHQGGRRRSVLRDFLGDANIKSLQSDGYNVYMYLDNELLDIEHLCCLAHTRNNFKDAFECGCSEASYFLNRIGILYGNEERYQLQGLTPEEIKAERNSESTNIIIKEIQLRMLELLGSQDETIGFKMKKALNYLHTFWKQLFAYRNDGNYSIDNLPAERAIRPMTVQRKNSLFFGSTNGAVRSAVYNTFIETCKLAGISFSQYFKKLVIEMNKGRTDYENLLPMTIAIE